MGLERMVRVRYGWAFSGPVKIKVVGPYHRWKMCFYVVHVVSL